MTKLGEYSGMTKMGEHAGMRKMGVLGTTKMEVVGNDNMRMYEFYKKSKFVISVSSLS
ncbi:MAG: hypothetical protein IPM38_09385 [Ignavibacteria bacterium]|nr:hypothetical protein [Ignavibacteria bacterium]